jgi:hypothetical protein
MQLCNAVCELQGGCMRYTGTSQTERCRLRMRYLTQFQLALASPTRQHRGTDYGRGFCEIGGLSGSVSTGTNEPHERILGQIAVHKAGGSLPPPSLSLVSLRRYFSFLIILPPPGHLPPHHALLYHLRPCCLRTPPRPRGTYPRPTKRRRGIVPQHPLEERRVGDRRLPQH